MFMATKIQFMHCISHKDMLSMTRVHLNAVRKMMSAATGEAEDRIAIETILAFERRLFNVRS
jgi:hypothetical protein